MSTLNSFESLVDFVIGNKCEVCLFDCPGFQLHSWRKTCKHCKCAMSKHVTRRLIDNRISCQPKTFELCFGTKTKPNSIKFSQSNTTETMYNYSWTPPNLNNYQIQAYFSQLHPDKVPLVGSKGDNYRLSQLLFQLPLYDENPQYCQKLTSEEFKKLQVFSYVRRHEAFGFGQVVSCSKLPDDLKCSKCKVKFDQYSVAVVASRSVQMQAWHPECFTCYHCDELLVDLIYCLKGADIYCGRHHAETMKPRCAACDELIFKEGYMQTNDNHYYHSRHFVCVQCDTALSDEKFILTSKGPNCIKCFKSTLAHYCDTCGEIIGLKENQLQHDGQHWHADEKCFFCHECKVSLVGKRFLPKNGQVFCSKGCCNQRTYKENFEVRNGNKGADKQSFNKNKSKKQLQEPIQICSKLQDEEQILAPRAIYMLNKPALKEKNEIVLSGYRKADSALEKNNQDVLNQKIKNEKDFSKTYTSYHKEINSVPFQDTEKINFLQNNNKGIICCKRSTLNYHDIQKYQLKRSFKPQNTLSNFISNPNLILNDFDENKNRFHSHSTINLSSFEAQQKTNFNREFWTNKKNNNEEIRRTKSFNSLDNQNLFGYIKKLSNDSVSESADDSDNAFVQTKILTKNIFQKQYNDDDYSWSSTSISSDESYERWDNWLSTNNSMKTQSNSNHSQVVFKKKRKLNFENKFRTNRKKISMKNNCIVM